MSASCCKQAGALVLCNARKSRPPKVLDQASRARQLRHHLESLERDNFVALNEYEAIIATAAAAASAPGPATLIPKNPLQDLETVGFGSIVGGVIGTAGSGSGTATPDAAATFGGRSKNKKNPKGSGISGTGAGEDASGGGGQGLFHAHKKPALPKKPLYVLLDESGLADYGPDVPTYLNANMGPSRYPSRQFCSVCGWKGQYRCSKCGMRYCDLKCHRMHEETRCMKFTI
ncbi:hypothetical protein EDD11_004999 [Mortierella claussenii]|nr:hypothetical protein EDD11_004999 [Mortierella claussenii]